MIVTGAEIRSLPSFRRWISAAVFCVSVVILSAGTALAAGPDTTAELRAELEAVQDEIADLQADSATFDIVGEDTSVSELLAGIPVDEFMLARVVDVQEAAADAVAGTGALRTYTVRLTTGPERGTEQLIAETLLDAAASSRDVAAGELVVVVKSYQFDGTVLYYVADVFRLPALIGIAFLFFVAACWFGGVRGFTSILGLASTVAVILAYVVPSIVAGRSPFITCLVAAFMIATLSLYLAHGFNARTTVAYVGTILTVAISAVVGSVFVVWSRLFGMGSEDAFFLQGSGLDTLDLRGLLLGGMILGALGIVDDITTAQSAIVEELKRANPQFGISELYRRASSVGREHIASLINTLFLAYAGVSLPLFLLFAVNAGQPFWFIVNGEMIAEEVVRTLVGSFCLVLAVPITTALAATYYAGRTPSDAAPGATPHAHRH